MAASCERDDESLVSLNARNFSTRRRCFSFSKMAVLNVYDRHGSPWGEMSNY